jgi:hypothetical protein
MTTATGPRHEMWAAVLVMLLRIAHPRERTVGRG